MATVTMWNRPWRSFRGSRGRWVLPLRAPMGRFFHPHRDHLGIPLPSSITPEGEVGVHDGQAGEGRHQARGRAPGPGAGVGRGGGASAVTVAAQQCRALSTTTVRGSAGYAKGSVRGEARPHHGPRERLGEQKGQRLGAGGAPFDLVESCSALKIQPTLRWAPTIILFFINGVGHTQKWRNSVC